MKKLLIALLVVAMVAVSFTACGAEKTDTTPTDNTTPVENNEDTTETPAPTETLTVEFGDFEGQQAVSKSIQNLECTGYAVEIEGISSKYGTHYSIGQKNDNGEFTGTTYEFDGEYPADGAHVKLVGVVVTEGIVSSISATSVEVLD